MQHPLHGVLMRAAAELELPEPRRFAWVFRGSVETVEAELEEGPAAWMRVPRASFGLAALLREQTAISKLLAFGLEGLPLGYRITRVGAFPVAAHHRPTGTPGVVAAQQDPVAAAEAAGRWLSEIPDLELQFGSMGDGTAFRPRAADWSGEVAFELADARHTLARAGLGLGAVEERLSRNVSEADLKADRFAVVHRDFVPQRCTMDRGRIASVFGWERAWAADPLAQWAPAVLQPAPILAAMIRGAGAEHVYDPEQREKVLAYASLGVLTRLASQVRTLQPVGHQYLAEVQANAVADAGLLERLDSHLDEARPGSAGAWSGWTADPIQLLLRRFLRVVGERNRMLGDLFEEGLAAVLLSSELEGEAQSAWLREAERVLQPFEEPWQQAHPRLPSAPSPAVSTGETAWGCRASLLYTAALEKLDGVVDPAVHAGIQARTWVLASRDQKASCSLEDRMRHGLMKVARDSAEVPALVEIFERNTIPVDEDLSWEGVTREVVLARAPALFVARRLAPGTLPFDPLAIAACIDV